MNSNNARRSAADMRTAQKQTIAQAEAVQKTVAVMEPNWNAMISSQKQQVETLAQILELLGQLATEERLITLMQAQIDFLSAHQEAAVDAMQNYQTKAAKATAEAETLMKTAAREMEKRSGQLSEKFSCTLSEQQKKLGKWMLRCLLIGLIPSVLQVILLLTQLILQRSCWISSTMTTRLKIAPPDTMAPPCICKKPMHNGALYAENIGKTKMEECI